MFMVITYYKNQQQPAVIFYNEIEDLLFALKGKTILAVGSMPLIESKVFVIEADEE